MPSPRRPRPPSALPLPVPLDERSSFVRSDELRLLLRLEGELGELPRGSEQQRRHALAGLGALLGAKTGLWWSVVGAQRGGELLRDPVAIGWSGEDRALGIQPARLGAVKIMAEYLALATAGAAHPPVGTLLRARTPPAKPSGAARSPRRASSSTPFASRATPAT